jgi:amino acid adenylation domain-containing protein
MQMDSRAVAGFRLSPQQRRLWSLGEAGDAGAYHSQMVVRIHGRLERERLVAAIRGVHQRHEILRTTFQQPAGLGFPLQVITEQEPPTIIEQDLHGLSQAEASARIVAITQAQAHTPWDFQGGPLLRVLLLGLAPEQHVLVISAPALVADRAALRRLLDEIGDAYAGPVAGGEVVGEPLQYADLAEWQNRLVEEQDRAPASAHWTRDGVTDAAPPRLPIRRFGTTPTPCFAPARVAIPVDAGIVARLEELTRTFDCSLGVLLLASWQVLLARVAGQERFVIGAGCRGRKHQELESVIGLFESCVPVSCEVRSSKPFEELVTASKAALHAAEMGQEHFRWEGTPSASAPFFAVAFEFDDVRATHRANGVVFSLERLAACTDRFEIKLACVRTAGGLIADLHYDTSQFEEADVMRLAAQLDILLRSVSRNPASRIGRLAILDDGERAALLAAGNETVTDFPRQSCVHRLFEEQASRTPERIAVCGAGEPLRYAELDERAGRLAQRLRRLGVGPEVRVAICVPRSPAFVVAVLGVLKAGGAYVPLDPSNPGYRLAFVLHDAKASVLLTERRVAQDWSAHAETIVWLDDEDGVDDGPEASSTASLDVQSPVSPDGLAYVIYTSGSTGQPKGTMVPHRALVNYLTWAARTYARDDGGGAPVHSSVGFDLTVTSLFVPLLSGETVRCVPDDHGIEALSRLLPVEGGFSFVKLTPSHLEVLNQLLPAEAVGGRTRALVLGGEALRGESLSRWRRHAASVRFINEYGPTETTVGCCFYEVPPDALPSGPVPIGHPIANTRVYLLDEEFQPAPHGSLGEIYVGGVGVARGYADRPDLTAAQFVPDPFGDEPGGRLYRTGDLGRRLPDGNLEFVGRFDRQVKIRGHRVELGEIEAVLRQHPSVHEAAVIVREDPPGTRRLTAYVVGRHPATAATMTTELRHFIAQRLPEHEAPHALVFLSALPLGPSGKVDRAALPPPDAADVADPSGEPRTLEEEVLAGIWCQVLGRERVGIDDDYFALGGDSIRSIQVLPRARAKGLFLTLEDIFRHRTIRALARALRGASIQEEHALVEPFGLLSAADRRRLPDDVENAYPLTMLQAGMIYHREYSPDSAIYHDISSIHLRAALDPDAVRVALAHLVARHPSLRTTFDLTTYSEPLQLVHRTGHLPLEVADLRGRSAAEQNTSVGAWIEEEKRNGFDHVSGPLLRAALHLRGPDTFQFTLSFHHAVLDGWSDATVLTELFGHSVALTRGEARTIAAPLASFQDYVALERHALRSEAAQSYWAHKLSDAAVMTLPRRRAGRGTPRRMIVRRVTIPPGVSDGLKRLALQTAVPIKSVLLAAHVRVMSLLAGQDDVLTCLTASGRPDVLDGERVVGLFLNSMPFRLKVAGGSWADLVGAAFEAEREALPFRRYPMAEVARQHGGRRLSETVFYFTHYHIYQPLRGVAGLEVVDHAIHEETSFSLVTNCGLTTFTSDVYMNMTADSRHIDEEQLEAISGYYERALAEIAKDATRSCRASHLLSERQEKQVLRDWNPTSDLAAPERCLHELFEAQAARTPHAPALTYEGQSLCYRDVNRRANQLARHLATKGVGADTRVGVCMSRSPAFTIAILAVLKAGGAYVPLDPGHPRDRLRFLIEDARPAVIISEQHLAALFEGTAASVVMADAHASVIARERGEDLAATARPDNAAYVIYTSGSTGRPKGVVISHANVAGLFAAAADWLKPSDRDVWTLFHSHTFDFSVWEMWGALLFGGRLVVVPQQVARESETFHELLVRERVTVLNQTPSAFRQLISADARRPVSTELSLRLVIFGGETLDPEMLAPWFGRYGDGTPELVNMYGITETSVHVTRRPLTKDDVGAGSVIGRPLSDVPVYLLDEHLQPVPPGTTAEMYVGGGGLARGYLGHPELTAQRFVPDPFSRRPGARLYRTGDLARHRMDGDLEFRGRVDHQVKIRGYRIELGEIEALLAQHPAVHEAAAARLEDEDGVARLVAYVAGDRPDATALRTHLEEKVPEYMVPAAIVVLEALPRTPGGKIDRQALPAPGRDRRDVASSFRPPRTPVEEVLANIWAAVFGLDQVGIEDTFANLGGHSLIATQLVALVRQAFQVDLPLQSLYEHPTVATLAAVISERKGNGASYTVLPQITPRPDRKHLPFPLTEIQQAYWVGRSGAFEIGNVASHIYIELESPDLDLERFAASWRTLVDRHDMLRAVTLPDGSQRILESVPPYTIDVDDLRSRDPEAVEAHLASVRGRLSHEVRNTDRWPLFEIRGSRLDGGLRLHISADAMNVDAGSFAILTRELARLYAHPETTLPPLHLSYRDYVLAEATLAEAEAGQRSQAYWFDRLATLPSAPQLPLTKPPGAVAQPLFSRRSARLEPDVWRRLKTRASRKGLTGSGLLLAAFSEVLALWSRTPRFTLNVTLFNRLPLHPEVNDIVGDFTSMELLAVDHSGLGGFEKRARRIQEQLWADLDHRYVSGIRVLREMGRRQGRTAEALMPVVFTSTLGLDDPSRRGPALTQLGEIVYSVTQTSQVLLDHQASESEGYLVLHWDAIEELFPAGCLDDMFDAYFRLLQRLAEGEAAWSDTAGHLVPSAQLQYRAAVNATETPVPNGRIHDLITAQVAERPHQPAVIAAGRTLTYENVQLGALRVGRWLRDAGAQPNHLVAVVMDKGWESVVAALGVLHSGAAYLPIDPALPTQRRFELFEDGRTDLVLTQSSVEERLEWPDGTRRLCVDRIALEESEGPLGDAGSASNDLAYVLYTSGSTGKPKGVMIEHRSVVNRIVDVNRRFGVGASDRALAVTALHHDLSVYDLFGVLAAGATLVMPSESGSRDPAEWARLMTEHRVTLWNSVPAFMEMLVEYLEHAPHDSREPPLELRLALLAGDWIPLALPDRLRRLLPGVDVVGLGGPTETTVWDICYRIGDVDPHWKSIPYGRPMTNAAYHVLNDDMEPCPVWVAGQIYIGGVGLARGYWQDDARTAASFLRHPVTGDRLYKSGDVGRYLPDGTIEILGRSDLQVKIRGNRIEPGEVEHALLSHPRVRSAVVVAVGNGDDRSLAAFVVPSPAEPPGIIDDMQSLPDATLRDPLRRIDFKLSQHALRADGGDRPGLQFARPDLDAVRPAYLARQSHRRFSSAALPSHALGELLSCLRQVAFDGAPLPKYRYPSAGGLYPVQTYVYVKPDRVDGLVAGTYYYHPRDHRLVLLTQGAQLDSTLHPAANRDLFEASAFSLFLIGHFGAIAPMYGALARDFCLIEAGAMSQLLMTEAPASGIGLCPIGALSFERLQEPCALDESHIFLHGLLGGPIEAAQSRTLAVLDSFANRGGSGGREPDGERLAAELRSFLLKKIPGHMVPSTFTFRESLPLTPNGKVDRSRVLECAVDQAVEPASTPLFVVARTRMQRAIAKTVREVLKVDKVGIDHNFFDLGGNSLHIVQAHHKLEATLGLEISIVEMFAHPTIRALAERLDRGRGRFPLIASRTAGRGKSRRRGRDQMEQARRPGHVVPVRKIRR